MKDLTEYELFEDWFCHQHKDLISSCWISEDTKHMYKNLLKQAYVDGFKTGTVSEYTRGK